MCQQIIQFCANSARPLLFAGSALTLLLAVAIGYAACSANSLFVGLDPAAAESQSLAYHLQLLAAVYLAAVTVLGCVAAHYDHKHVIRGLAVVTSVNVVLALVAVLLAPSGAQLADLFASRLVKAQALYNFTERPPTGPNATLAESLATNLTGPAGKSRPSRMADSAPPASKEPEPEPAPELTSAEATRIWDSLQARGCCGLRNATLDWPTALPKSCCSKADRKVDGDKITCPSVDSSHDKGCLAIIESSSANLLLLLALAALVNLYLSIVTGFGAYRTLHYDEANQTAYS